MLSTETGPPSCVGNRFQSKKKSLTCQRCESKSDISFRSGSSRRTEQTKTSEALQDSWARQRLNFSTRGQQRLKSSKQEYKVRQWMNFAKPEWKSEEGSTVLWVSLRAHTYDRASLLSLTFGLSLSMGAFKNDKIILLLHSNLLLKN